MITPEDFIQMAEFGTGQNKKANNMKTIQEIITMPTCIDSIHQSCYRESAILGYVKMKLQNKVCHETILELIGFMQNSESKSIKSEDMKF